MAWEEIVDYTVPSNTTSVTFNNFGTITKDDFIKINISSPTNASGFMKLLANSTSANDYYGQTLFANGTSLSSSRQNENRLNASSDEASTFIMCKLSENNVFNIFSNQTKTTSAEAFVAFNYITSTNATFTNGITSFTITQNTLGANSRIQIYRLTAEKVADIFAPAGNNLQVDITGLNIDKGSEYLLVGYLDNQQSQGSTLGLFYNNETNNTNYYNQRIQAFGASISANRFNFPAIATTPSFIKSAFYTHIKLSSIGSFITQSYSVGRMGTSDVGLYNDFTSSVAENINQITTLNVKSLNNQRPIIGGGSRFELYKLY